MRQLTITKSITNRESASLEKYLQEISRIDLISVDEEVILSKRIRNGDLNALEELTKANLRFVVSVAKQYQKQGLNLTDLINEGNIGLIKAAQKFDETRGFKFISYAVWWIRQSIIQAIAESRLVRLPLNRIGCLNKIHNAFIQFEQKHERDPTSNELADLINIEPEEVRDTFGLGGRHISMDAPMAASEGNTLMEVFENPNAEEADRHVSYKESLSREIDRSLSTLSPAHKKIVQLFFGIGQEHAMNKEDIAAKFNISPERVRQIKDKAVKRLQTTSRCKLLKAYLGQ